MKGMSKREAERWGTSDFSNDHHKARFAPRARTNRPPKPVTAADLLRVMKGKR